MEEVTAGSGHVGPNQMITWIRFSPTNSCPPVLLRGAHRRHAHPGGLRQHAQLPAHPQHDERIGKRNVVVAQEDIDIRAKLDPVPLLKA